MHADTENSPKLESMPTLCRSATLPAETTISKWRVTAIIRQFLQLPTGGTLAFGCFSHVLIKNPSCEAVNLPLWQGTIDVCFINCA